MKFPSDLYSFVAENDSELETLTRQNKLQVLRERETFSEILRSVKLIEMERGFKEFSFPKEPLEKAHNK